MKTSKAMAKSLFVNVVNIFNVQIRSKKTIFVSLMFVSFLIVTFEARAGWRFWEKKETCQSLVEPIIKRPLIITLLTKNDQDMDHIKKKCYELILKDGDYKELYAYYKLYEYADKALKEARNGKDETANNIYHYMLFYANENSRDFDSKTNSFKKEQGLYEEELKDFEDSMTQEEKIKSFSYIADNLATGTEGWVKVHDYRKSFEYLKRAAEAGDRFSQAELGTCYFFGADRFFKFVFPKSYIQAYKWTYISTKHSKTNSYEHEIGLRNLKRISLEMTDSQVEKSKEESFSWLEDNQKFIKENPLYIMQMTDEQIKNAKEDSQRIIKKYNMSPQN